MIPLHFLKLLRSKNNKDKDKFIIRFKQRFKIIILLIKSLRIKDLF
ncbi:hypothetical protein YN1551_1958 [Sulfolobus islandicus Y.N.15.51]|uniref:Uncharacterized protein n=1 Tax=Saccharolobus islandicus (strain Y.N.15.51 / Yellowstone \|nr:hypothetical protein YN1551_1958 [Sulfolobus islandicus Y.N.15.51]